MDLAINPVTNRLYVAIPEARQIQVIDGITDHVIQNITIGANPNAVALNPYANKIYVASPETDMIYVIDGLTNNITAKIQTGPIVGDIAVDTNEFGGFSTLIFVANTGNASISIIDDTKGKVVSNINATGPYPYGVGVDSIKNRAYITTDLGVDIIDYTTSLAERNVIATLYDTIYWDYYYVPTGIAVNSNTSRAYVTNSAVDTISVVDTTSNDHLYEIKVEFFPNSLAFNPASKKLFVSNTGNNTVSVIDTTIETNTVNKTVQHIPIDNIPYDVAVNPNTNIMYLANFESKTLSTINGTSANKTVALTFHLDPPNAGHIVCTENGKEKKIPENTYQRITINKTHCKAVPNSGFVFGSWSSEAPSHNSTGIPGNHTLSDALWTIVGRISGNATNRAEESYEVSQYGVYTANFLSLPPIIQAASPYVSMCGLASVILLAAIKPTFHTRKNKAKKEVDEKNEENEEGLSNLPEVYRSKNIEKEGIAKQEER